MILLRIIIKGANPLTVTILHIRAITPHGTLDNTLRLHILIL
jgi:hypothetical protein